MMTNDSCHDERTYHKAQGINDKGTILACCGKRIGPASLSQHQLWTTQWEAVTCSKCLALKAKRDEDES